MRVGGRLITHLFPLYNGHTPIDPPPTVVYVREQVPTGMPFPERDQFHTANDLLQAGLQGRLSRRELIERAMQLGLATGVTAAILAATGPDVAAADPVTDGKKTKPPGKEIQDAEIAVGVVGSIETLNPWTTNLYAQGFDVLSGVMDALVGFDSRQRMKPVLAESYAISDDGLTYTFELRKDITFQNGDPLTSADIAATWQTIMNQDLPTWSRLGWDKISSIDTPSPTTAVVHTASIFAPFLSSIAAGSFSSGAIGPASILTGDPAAFRDQFDQKPIGTGPFRIKSVRKESIILERYDKHWAGKARLKRITVRLFDTFEDQHAALAAGEIQIAGRTGSPADQHLETALAITETTVLQFPGLTWGHLDLKNIGALSQTDIRQALDFATPREQIIKRVLGNAAQPAAADQAPGSGYASQRIEPRPLDLEKSAAKLTAAGYTRPESGNWSKDGQPLEIDLWGEQGDTQAEAILTLIGTSWSAAGIATRINLAPAEELWGPTGYQFNDRLTAGFYRWANVNDPDDMFYWHSSQIPTWPGGPGGNVPAFFNQYSFQSEIDDLTSRAAAQTDPVLRKNIYLQIQDLLHDQVPVIFLFWDYGFSAVADTIGNYLPSAFTYLLWNAREWYQTRPA